MKKNSIEQLIESTYRELHPPPTGGDELFANLPPQRQASGPSLRKLLPIAALLLIGLVIGVLNLATFTLHKLADDKACIRLSVVSRPSSGVVQPAKDECPIRVAASGHVFVLQAKKWTSVSLNGLGEHLKRAVASHGKYRKTKHNIEASELPIVLVVDRAVPWQYIQWIMTICAEQRAPELCFLVRPPEGRDYRLDAALPTDIGSEEMEVVEDGGNPPKLRRKPRINAKVLVRPGKDGIEYGFIDRKAVDLSVVARWISDAKKAGAKVGANVDAEIKAIANTPFAAVAKVMAEFRKAGYRRVLFFGTRIPDKKTREMSPLAFPRR